MRSYFKRHQPGQPMQMALMAGMGGLIAIAALGGLSLLGQSPLIMAPFGASCVLLFSVPGSPLSQPANIIGGHVLAAFIALLLHQILPPAWWAEALAVGAAIAAMAALRVTHPPAGANPLVVFAADPGFSFLLLPVAAGACLLVAIAHVYHRASGTPYPVRPGQ